MVDPEVKAEPLSVSVLEAGRVTELVVTPRDFGVEPIGLDALRGGDATENAAAIVAMLGGEGHPALAAVILNAAAALSLVRGHDLRACAEEARSVVESRRAHETLENWRLIARAATEPR